MSNSSESFFEDINIRRFFLALLFLIAVCAGICIYIDIKAFLVNLLSGIAVSGISLIAGFIVVDRVIEYLRDNKWSKARKLVFRSMTHHYHEIITWMSIYLKVEQGIERPLFVISRTFDPNQATIEYSGQLIENLIRIVKAREPLSSQGTGYMSDLTAVIKFYKLIEWRLDHIDRALVPRLIEASAEQALIDALIEFELSIHKFRNSIKYCEFDVCDNEVFPSFIDFISSFYQFYKLMHNRF